MTRIGNPPTCIRRLQTSPQMKKNIRNGLLGEWCCVKTSDPAAADANATARQAADQPRRQDQKIFNYGTQMLYQFSEAAQGQLLLGMHLASARHPRGSGAGR